MVLGAITSDHTGWSWLLQLKNLAIWYSKVKWSVTSWVKKCMNCTWAEIFSQESKTDDSSLFPEIIKHRYSVGMDGEPRRSLPERISSIILCQGQTDRPWLEPCFYGYGGLWAENDTFTLVVAVLSREIRNWGLNLYGHMWPWREPWVPSSHHRTSRPSLDYSEVMLPQGLSRCVYWGSDLNMILYDSTEGSELGTNVSRWGQQYGDKTYPVIYKRISLK